MKFRGLAIAMISTGFVVSPTSALAKDQEKSLQAAGSQSYCFYQDQKYSEGWVQNGMVCTRGRAAPVENGSRDDGRPTAFMWVAQEKTGLTILHQQIEKARLEIQLIQARSALIEAEARQSEVASSFKKSDKK